MIDVRQDLIRCGISDKGRRTSVGPIMGIDADERQVYTAGRDLKMFDQSRAHSALQVAPFLRQFASSSQLLR